MRSVLLSSNVTNQSNVIGLGVNIVEKKDTYHAVCAAEGCVDNSV